MKSELLPGEMYVLCIGCAVAEPVDDVYKLRNVMKRHEKAIPSHHGFINNRPTGTKLFCGNGPALNKIVAGVVGDPREVKVEKLEVR